MSHEFWARGVMTAGLTHARMMRDRIAKAQEDTARNITEVRKRLGRLEEADADMAASVEALDVEIAKVAP